MKRFLFYFLLTVFVLSILNGQTANVQSAAPFDTDFVTWHQPNGVTFIAWFWGDEFISWFETQDGYRIYRAANGWYYYATLDSIGEYTGSSFCVGI